MVKIEDGMAKLKGSKVKYPIGLKLVLIISFLLVISLGVVSVLEIILIREDVQLTAEQNNYTINTQTADIAKIRFETVRNNSLFFMNTLNTIGFDSPDVQTYADSFFNLNNTVAAIVIPQTLDLVNTDFFETNELEESLVEMFLHTVQDDVERCKRGETLVLNATPVFSIPSIAFMIPWTNNGLYTETQPLVLIFTVESLTETFGTGTTNTSFMINHRNDLLIHPDFDLIKLNANMSDVSLVSQMRINNDENRQVIFTDSNGVEFFGAYTKLPIADIGILTTIASSLVFEGVTATVYQNAYLALSVLSLAILFTWFFSRSISKPVKILALASEQIQQGNFKINMKPRTNDEVGLLTSRFLSMSKGLETFGRFVNMDIALRAMKGDLELGGETKEATIFFSDIRMFTAISEKLEPQEVITFLNEYMTRMVACVRDTNGTVDKFIGDAVMAVWGASTSAGSASLDAFNAVKASLLMRAALIEYNKDRGDEKKPIIKIGCGLNTGSVVAGQMGSSERMEYTVIGDAVNLASRTETLTKPFCADILITEDTYALVKDHVLVEKMPSVTVKGKEKPVSIYAVINMPNETSIPGMGNEGPKNIQELRDLLNLDTPNFESINTDAQEQKYEIG